jgi:flavin reductase (DIM6/NTAB) family NADH-FMN oxidoreductase RutF
VIVWLLHLTLFLPFSFKIYFLIHTTGNYNIITLAWTGIVSSTPPALEISIHKQRYSLELIQKTKEFTVNIPSAEYYIETDYCGIVSGKDGNKFADTRLTPIKSSIIKTPIIKECPLNLECKVLQEIKIGDYTMFIGEIVETHIDSDKFVKNNKSKVDIKKVNPLIYCATIREYWTIGEKLGDGFSCGLELKKKLSAMIHCSIIL